MGLIVDIKEQVRLVRSSDMLNYIEHIGGTWHVSVNDKYPTAVSYTHLTLPTIYSV